MPTESHHIPKLGNDLKDMKIGIRQVVTRQFCLKPKPKNHLREFSLILLHSLIVFFTIIVTVEVLIPNGHQLMWYERLFSQDNLLSHPGTPI